VSTITARSAIQAVRAPWPNRTRLEYLSQEFLALYPNRAQSIIKHASAKNWVTVSKFHSLTDTEIIDAVSAQQKFYRGCRWGEYTRFLVLDIDIGSKYHNFEGLSALRKVLKLAGVANSKLYQSSVSGGWHLYVFWKELAPTEAVTRLFKSWLQSQGFEIRGGTLELFPSGNGLRLPMQSGFAWLDDQGLITQHRQDISLEQALDQFMADLYAHGNSWEYVSDVLESKLLEQSDALSSQSGLSTQDLYDQSGQFDQMVLDATNQLDTDRWEKGREYWINGLTKQNQRHEAILYVGYYLWFGDRASGMSPLPGRRCAGQRLRLLTDWLEQKHHGYCRHITAGRWDKVEADIHRAVHWTRYQALRQRVPYLVTDRLIDRQMQTNLTVEEMREANLKRERRARRMIEAAVGNLLAEGKNVSIRALERATGCSRNTIRRHRDLLLSNGSGDLSPGGVGSPGDSPVIDLVLVREKEKKERASEVLELHMALGSVTGSGEGTSLLEDVQDVSISSGSTEPSFSQLLLFPLKVFERVPRTSEAFPSKLRQGFSGRSPPRDLA
jgi:hypothetical protein